jgi:hypothetical protein
MVVVVKGRSRSLRPHKIHKFLIKLRRPIVVFFVAYGRTLFDPKRTTQMSKFRS